MRNQRESKVSHADAVSALAHVTDNARGILWALLATALFAITSAMAKSAVNDYHVLQILFFRQLIVFLFCLPILARTFPAGLKIRHPRLHAVRLLGAFVALSFNIWAIATLPLTTVVTLGFAQLFFVALLSHVFLKETVDRHRVGAIVIGFIGVVVVMRPGVSGIVNPFAFIAIIAAFGAAVASVSVRRLSQTESTATLLVYQALFVGTLSAVPLLWLWVQPDLIDTVFLLAMGVVAAAGNWAGVNALRLGEATVVGNIKYTELIFAAALGLLLFNEVPDLHTIVGATIIISSSIFMLRRATLEK